MAAKNPAAFSSRLFLLSSASASRLLLASLEPRDGMKSIGSCAPKASPCPAAFRVAPFARLVALFLFGASAAGLGFVAATTTTTTAALANGLPLLATRPPSELLLLNFTEG